MKIKTAKVLPKIAAEIVNGGLYLQRVRCGKPNCKCVRGETHPAYYFFARRAGKLVKIYVRRAELENFAALVQSAVVGRTSKRTAMREADAILKRLREAVRESAQTVKLYQETHYTGETIK